MRIVVPTDFSQLSKIAVRYAISFARQTGSQIILIHFLPPLGPSLGTASTDELKKEMAEEAEMKMQELLEELQEKEIIMEPQYAYGVSLEDELQTFITTHNIDLVIIGSKGASGLKKVILGSSTVSVINHCSVPIIIVPECAVIGKIEYLVYASDFKNLRAEVARVIPYARYLNVAIKIIHVQQPNDPTQSETDKLIAEIKQEFDFDRIQWETLNGKNVVQSIEAFTEVQEAELLIMFTHATNFLEQLFSKSFTREVAWRSTTPMLVINNR